MQPLTLVELALLGDNVFPLVGLVLAQSTCISVFVAQGSQGVLWPYA